MKRETIGRLVLLLMVALFSGVPLGLRAIRAQAQVVEIHARMPENGGWSRDLIRVQAGQPLKLRITSDDVVHGFAIGKLDMTPLDLLPGEMVETTLTFDEPGRYTFYCSRWCGVNHWRMHGVIEVTGEPVDQTPAETPLYIQLGIDIDAPHMASVIPLSRPSAENGAQFADLLPDYAAARMTYLSNSPADLWLKLREEPGLSQLTDAELWDVIRWLWARQSDAESIGAGLKLFIDMAAAAHGITGKGDGVMVRDLPAMDHQNGHGERVRPPDFTDPQVLLGASPALLEGKILRGGMGTGMPSFGAILTSQQIDAVVDYLYTIAWDALPDQPEEGTADAQHAPGELRRKFKKIGQEAV